MAYSYSPRSNNLRRTLGLSVPLKTMPQINDFYFSNENSNLSSLPLQFQLPLPERENGSGSVRRKRKKLKLRNNRLVSTDDCYIGFPYGNPNGGTSSYRSSQGPGFMWNAYGGIQHGNYGIPSNSTSSSSSNFVNNVSNLSSSSANGHEHDDIQVIMPQSSYSNSTTSTGFSTSTSDAVIDLTDDIDNNANTPDSIEIDYDSNNNINSQDNIDLEIVDDRKLKEPKSNESFNNEKYTDDNGEDTKLPARFKSRKRESKVVAEEEEGSPKLRELLRKALVCPVCMDPCRDITSTMCGHIYCRDCIVSAIHKYNSCPLCSQKLNHHMIHPLYF